MSELKFILKSLLLTVAILFVMQIHWGELTIESRFQNWMKTSKVTQFLRKSSTGGALAMERAYHSVEKSVRGTASTPSDHRDEMPSDDTYASRPAE